MKINKNLTSFATPVLFVVVAVANISLWYYGRGFGFQVTTIVFALVWLNILLAAFVYKKQKNITHILLGASLVLELLLLINLAWVIGRMM